MWSEQRSSACRGVHGTPERLLGRADGVESVRTWENVPSSSE